MPDDGNKLNDRVDTVASEVLFTGELCKLVASGKLVMLAVFLYRPDDDALVVSRSSEFSAEEVDAMLRKFDFPHKS